MNIAVKKFAIERAAKALLPGLISIFTISLTCCYPLDGGAEQREESKSRPDSTLHAGAEAPIETTARNIFHRNDLNDIVGFIGKTAGEIIHEAVSSYYRFADGGEVFLTEDGQVYLRFSDEVWEEGSECVAAVFPPRWLTDPENAESAPTIRDVKAYLGIEFEYCREGESDSYKYSFSDLEMKVYVADDGMTLYNRNNPEKYAVIQLKGAHPVTDVRNNAEREAVNPKDVRLRPEWETTDRYISHIGKTLEETETLSGHALEAIGDEGDYEDAETKTRYFFDPDRNGLCTAVYIPASTLFPMKNGIMTKAELSDYWKDVSFGWSCYEGLSQYTFLFEDAAVIVSLFEENWNATWDVAEGSTVVIRN
jgi:hypothetical protein